MDKFITNKNLSVKLSKKANLDLLNIRTELKKISPNSKYLNDRLNGTKYKFSIK